MAAYIVTAWLAAYIVTAWLTAYIVMAWLAARGKRGKREVCREGGTRPKLTDAAKHPSEA